MTRSEVDPRFGQLLRALLDERGMSYRALATRVYQSKTHLHELATGLKAPTVEVATRLDNALDAGGSLLALAGATRAEPRVTTVGTAGDVELMRRVEASDVGEGMLARLEKAADDMAMSYASTPPGQLLPRVRRHLTYITGLVDARMAVDGRRRLLIAGGWLALLAATLHIDLRQREAAIDELLTVPGGVPRPRRVASARLDLALALLAADRPDEASAEALSAVTSGRIVPSNWWRATEVLHGVEQTGVPDAQELLEAYRAFRPAPRELTA